MVRLSSLVILVGIVLIIAPLPPPIGLILGIPIILVGLALRFLGNF